METILHENPVRVKERRLTNRVQKCWRACVNGRLPSWADIQTLDFGNDWASCFALDLSLSGDFPYFIYMGENLGRLSDLYLAEMSEWDVSPLDLAAAKMDEAALSKEPVGYTGGLRLPGGRRIIFRSVLLPLSENGDDVTHIFGAVTGKTV